jgi:predicted  nucleic acid-binding Zn-ribbon protein
MTKLEKLRKEIYDTKDLVRQEVKVIFFKNKDLKERCKDLHIDLIKISNFGYYSINNEALIHKTDLIIYTSKEGVSKVLFSRY